MTGFQLTQLDEALVFTLDTFQGLRGTLRITPEGLVFVASQSHTSYLLAKRVTRAPKAAKVTTYGADGIAYIATERLGQANTVTEIGL